MLITAQALKEALAAKDVVVFDCRFSLADADAGRRAYQDGHIPTALYLHLDADLSGPKGQGGGRHPLPNPDVLAAKFGARGVTKDKTVIAYDNGEGMAARAWWLLRWLGHSKVALLDGGFQAWQDAGFALECETIQPQATEFTADVQSEMIMPLASVAEISAGKRSGTLVDARAASRYRGENETIDAQAGHIPSAANAPWQEGLDDAGKWLAGAMQRDRFAPLLNRSGPLVMYCGSGVTACNNLFALELAGVTGAKLYPGSWSEWSADSNRPIVQGAKPSV